MDDLLFISVIALWFATAWLLLENYSLTQQCERWRCLALEAACQSEYLSVLVENYQAVYQTDYPKVKDED